jgi:catechol 2,3-dioxygenase-like lactoylglutathione lyase family enzyme
MIDWRLNAMKTIPSYVLAGTVLVAMTLPVRAHHSFAAEFDQSKPVKLEGTVTKMEWINPHSWIHIDVAGEDGKPVPWMIEAGTPNTMVRRGFTRNSLLPGTEIVVEGFLSKDGSNRANGFSITFTDGRRLFVGGSAPRTPALATVVFADERADTTVAPLLSLPTMHVFRRHAVEPEQMFEFYGDVLGFERIPNIGAVGRLQTGGSEFKLQRRSADAPYLPGGPQGATGFRLVGFYFEDEAALVARFEQHGYPVPEFRSARGSATRVALTADPDGQPVELIIVPDASAATLQQIEIGLTVTDIERSRAFYREFVGLEELAPIEDPILGTTKYPFRHGSTLITLRSFGGALPADTSSGLIQYVVSNIERVDALAKERGVTIERPLTAPVDAPLRTLWIGDPDGITNYFTETAQSRAAAAQ